MSPIGLILIGIIIGIIITIIMIYIIKGGFKGIPSYEDRKHKKELEIYAELSAFKTEEKEKIDAELKTYRQKIDEELKVRRLEIDEELNAKVKGTIAQISTPNSKIKVLVVPTNEELMIARDVMRLGNIK